MKNTMHNRKYADINFLASSNFNVLNKADMSCVPSTYHLLTAVVMSRHYFSQKQVHELHISLECKKGQ